MTRAQLLHSNESLEEMGDPATLTARESMSLCLGIVCVKHIWPAIEAVTLTVMLHSNISL